MNSQYILSYEGFISLHKNQLQSSQVPPMFWQSLYHKLMADQLDAGMSFRIEIIQYSDDSESESSIESEEKIDNNEVNDNERSYRVIVIKENGINVDRDKSEDIYLIDHIFTYQTSNVFNILMQTNGLIERLTKSMELESEQEIETDRKARTVMKEMWKWNQCYAMQSEDVQNSLPVWYIMDEFGLRIQHSSDPSFRCIPFYFIPRGLAYSLLFPIRSVSVGEEVTRNYIEGSVNTDDFNVEDKELLSAALMIPWIPSDLSHIDCNQTEPDIAFMRSGRIEESIANNQTHNPQLPQNRKIKVYSEYRYLSEYLTDSSFEITDNKSEADILWLNTHFKEYKELSSKTPNVFINQFPFEHTITVKDLFAIICRRNNINGSVVANTLETSPKWLATTYNLQTEIVKFVSYYQKRQKLGLDNYWICKPWNLARGLDTLITDDLNCIIRLRNSVPKVVCKYISDPVLFRREDLNGSLVKFDIRYIVLLTSVNPLKVYVYPKFWLRFSNKSFSLDNFDDYEKHFTVMNYTGGETQLKQMECQHFIQYFNQQYNPEYCWSAVETSIYKTLRDVFECATARPAPHGIGHNLQSRAMYGVDVMLRWDSIDCTDRKAMQPVVLEVNWAPDCERACLYYSQFFNHVFSLLFQQNNHNNQINVIEI